MSSDPLSEEQMFQLREANFIEYDGEYGKTFFLPGVRGCGVTEGGKFFYRDKNDKKVFLDSEQVRGWGEDMIFAITAMMNVLAPKQERSVRVSSSERVSGVYSTPCVSLIDGKIRLNMAAVSALPGSESSYFTFSQSEEYVFLRPSSVSAKDSKKFNREYGVEHTNYALSFSSKAFLLTYFSDADSEKTVHKVAFVTRDGKSLAIKK